MRCLLAILLLTPTAAADVTAVYFGADYCQPCRSLRPSLARLQRAYDVQHVDAGDANQSATCRKYDITSIPQIVFIDDGKEIDRIQGTSPDWQRRCEDRLSGRNNWRPIRAAVRVRTPGGMGSGVILSSEPGRTVIATAAHMVRDESAQVSVDLWRDFGVKTFAATVETSNDTTDLALLLVAANSIPLPSVIGASESPGQGDVAFGIGCSGGRGVSVTKCRVLRIQDGDVFASGAPAQGRSGGGLFNARFELIGICSAAGDNDGWYIGAEKLKALLTEWNPASYQTFGVGVGVGVVGFTCVAPRPCNNPNCTRCRPQRVSHSTSIGPAGPRGERGTPGRDGSSPDLRPLIQRIEALEQQKRRVMLVDGSTGDVIDDESYAADEPIILDVQQLTK